MTCTFRGTRVPALAALICALSPCAAPAQTESTPPVTRGAFNPGIWALADLLVLYLPPSAAVASEPAPDEHATHDSDEGFRFLLREVELGLGASLDPYSRLRAVFAYSDHEVHVEEAWFEWSGLLPHLNLKAGRFRQALGPVNLRHHHAWDQLDLPLAMSALLGSEGLLLRQGRLQNRDLLLCRTKSFDL